MTVTAGHNLDSSGLWLWQLATTWTPVDCDSGRLIPPRLRDTELPVNTIWNLSDWFTQWRCYFSVYLKRQLKGLSVPHLRCWCSLRRGTVVAFSWLWSIIQNCRLTYLLLRHSKKEVIESNVWIVSKRIINGADVTHTRWHADCCDETLHMSTAVSPALMLLLWSLLH